MEIQEKNEWAAEAPANEPEAASMPSKSEMRRVFSRLALGLCLGLLISQLVPTVLALIPGFNAKAHTFLVGSLCTGLCTLPLMLMHARARNPPALSRVLSGC